MSNFALRIPESLLSSAKALASEEKTSLDQFFAIAIAEKVSAMKTADFFADRAARADLEDAKAVLAKVPRGAARPDDLVSEALRKRMRARLRKLAVLSGPGCR